MTEEEIEVDGVGIEVRCEGVLLFNAEAEDARTAVYKWGRRCNRWRNGDKNDMFGSKGE